MNYCTSNRQITQISEQVNEIKFLIQNLNGAITYATDHPEKRIDVIVSNFQKGLTPAISKMIQLQKDLPNMFYEFVRLADLLHYSDSIEQAIGINKDDKVPHHFYLGSIVSTWSLINILKKVQVSDILIGDPITFQLKAVKDTVKPYCKIRIYPHLARNRVELKYEHTNGENHFFMLPCQMHFYEDYIDTLDLTDPNLDREAGLLKTYLQVSDNSYPVNLIIDNVSIEIPAIFFTNDDDWVENRLNCGQRCLENANKCHYCSSYLNVYKFLSSNHNRNSY